MVHPLLFLFVSTQVFDFWWKVQLSIRSWKVKWEVQKKKKKEENKIESGFLKFFVVGIADVF
jgi:hypothetical protein